MIPAIACSGVSPQLASPVASVENEYRRSLRLLAKLLYESSFALIARSFVFKGDHLSRS